MEGADIFFPIKYVCIKEEKYQTEIQRHSKKSQKSSRSFSVHTLQLLKSRVIKLPSKYIPFVVFFSISDRINILGKSRTNAIKSYPF